MICGVTERIKEMSLRVNRREFAKIATTGLAAATLGAQTRRLRIGHTGITWGFQPADAEQAVKDVASLGYYGYESFGNVLEAWEPKGGLDKILAAGGLPLCSAYCPVTLTEPDKRKAETDKIVGWAKLIRKCGGSVAVIGPNSVQRSQYKFADHQADIVASLNDMAKAVMDVGLVGVLHQHTGTCVESREETYAVLNAVDTRYVKFGPDVGQLAKGGSNPVDVVKDFSAIIRHVHLKDFSGGSAYLGYCPLGQGKVDVPAIVDLLEKSGNDLMIMVELDPSPGMPMTPVETASVSKAYLQKLGYSFRS
jgi:inosose dehydratase